MPPWTSATTRQSGPLTNIADMATYRHPHTWQKAIAYPPDGKGNILSTYPKEHGIR